MKFFEHLAKSQDFWLSWIFQNFHKNIFAHNSFHVICVENSDGLKKFLLKMTWTGLWATFFFENFEKLGQVQNPGTKPNFQNILNYSTIVEIFLLGKKSFLKWPEKTSGQNKVLKIFQIILQGWKFSVGLKKFLLKMTWKIFR